MNIEYSWSKVSRSFNISWPKLSLPFLPTISRRRISFGFWITSTVDNVLDTTPASGDDISVNHEIYQRLEELEIRVLSLHPGEYDDPLSGNLSTYRLFEDDPDYSALSWTWGQDLSSTPIRIDDISLPISLNLEICLRRLRDVNKPTKWWIDSLCINQQDSREKALQVSMMDYIYHKAGVVKVWIGEETRYSEIGMLILKYFATKPHPTQDAPWKTYPPDTVLQSLQDVMQRRWFERYWVTQEAALSRKTEIICGDSSFSWQGDDVSTVLRFMRMVKYACVHPEWHNRGLHRVDMEPILGILDLQVGQQLDRSFGTSHRPAKDILDIAYDIRQRQSSDPRDRIFALLGILRDTDSVEQLRPDYSLTVEETWEQVANAIRF